MSDHGDQDDVSEIKKVSKRNKSDALRSLEFFSEIGTGAEVMMNSMFFQMANGWLRKSSGLDLRTVVLGMGLFVATRTYTSKALQWLEANGSNTLNLSSHETLAQDLELWVAQQPMNQQTLRFLCLLPSFQNMEWKNVSTSGSSSHNYDWNRVESSNAEEEQQGYSGYDFVASTGRSFFSFQGKLFVLEKQEYGDAKLRCFWGNSKPIHSLIKHVQLTSKHRGSLIQVHYVRGNGRIDTVQSKKRSLASIDMAPLMKQDLLTDLQDYFDPETKDWCFENGAPYRKGFMFHGPPGTGKTSLYQAIASEFNLPIYYMHLADMDDKSLHDEFQKLPKRCIVVFEEIDTMGIKRDGPLVTKPTTVESEDNSNDDSESDDNSDDDADSDADDNSEVDQDESETHTRNARHKKGKEAKSKQTKKDKPKRSRITLGALLNVLDGPGAKEGRLLIMTTNAPNSLDKALIRPGRIDRRVFLGYSTPLVASITFSRIFGTDPRLKGKLKRQDLDRMAREFGEKIPIKTFTPCEVQQYCMARRGKPQKAIAQLEQWIENKISGKEDKFEFDINNDVRAGVDEGVTSQSEEEYETWDDMALQGIDRVTKESLNAFSEPHSPLPAEGISENEHQLNADVLIRESPRDEAELPLESYDTSESHRGSIWRRIASISSSWLEDFHQFNDLSSEYYAGLRNMYPDDLPVIESGEGSDTESSIVLNAVDPMPIADVLVLHHSTDEEGHIPDARETSFLDTENDYGNW